MNKLTIDGKEVAAGEGDTILDVALVNDVFIPALCHHKAVSPYGACRLCLVEIQRGGHRRIVASCGYLADDGIIVDTKAAKAVHARNIAMELLLARCPDSMALRTLAKKMGVHDSRFQRRHETCVLCGLCVRVCKEVIGSQCIAFTGRGSDRQIATPYAKPSQDCVGCGACVAVCPIGDLGLEQTETCIVLPKLQTVIPRARCRTCGQHFASVRQVDHIAPKIDVNSEMIRVCAECRRKLFARRAVTIRP